MKTTLLLSISALLFFSCGGNKIENASDEVNDSSLLKKDLVQETIHDTLSEDQLLRMKADTVILLLREKNFNALSTYVHPEKGLRFSPYSSVSENDAVKSAKEVSGLYDAKVVLLWGTYDGSGEEIKLDFKNYYSRFIYDKDYSQADTVAMDNFAGGGNTINNVREFYPRGRTIDFHFEGTEKNGGMDWSTLRLVFEKKENRWFLAGIIHDQWTI